MKPTQYLVEKGKLFIVYCILLSTYSCNEHPARLDTEDEPDVEYYANRNERYGTLPEEVKSAIKARFESDRLQKITSPNGLGDISWQLIGPSNTGGRITDIEMPLSNNNIIYAGSASGGIFKSIDFGNSWNPIFDNAAALAIGDIEIDPNNDNIIYAGTGEPNTGGGSITYNGNGIYKSTDAGSTWQSIGLQNVGTIGKVSVAKTNSSVLYVAAVGNIYQKDTNKGLYKSTDAGSTWQKILYISDSTSVNDVEVSPVNANVLYATTWERISRPGVRVYGGITSNLFKSTDGGMNWTKLLADDANRGKMTIGIPPTNPNKLYISIANKNASFNTIYKYDGITFTPITNGINYTTSATYWFGGIHCHPTDENIVYFSDFYLYRTTDGGANWSQIVPSSHVDQHALFVHPTNTSKIVIGNDGGVYTSTDALSTISLSKIPNAQVYDFDVYKSDETYVSAGFQDNFFASTTNQVVNTWVPYGGGDGVQVRVNPLTREETYSYQYGGLNIPTTGISSSDRMNWKTPIILDPVNPAIRYIGSNKVYKYNPSTSTWTAISGDLTNGSGTGNFGTITSLAIAPTNNNYIYSGSDDGQVYVTKNGGSTWQNITSGLPVLWTTFIKVDRTNPDIAYVGFSGYRYGVYDAHIYKTINAGTTWTRISNDLPQVPVNDLETDPTQPNTFYLGTDIGMYYSINGGTNWLRLGVNMPNVVVSKLNFAVNSRQLYAATYGRSVYKLNLQLVALPNDNIKLSITVIPANHVQLQWSSTIAYNAGSFDVEQSINGNDFMKIGTVTQVPSVNNMYQFTTSLANSNKLFFRIKYLDNAGKKLYSSIVEHSGNNNPLITAYPNPANNYVTFQRTGRLNNAIISIYHKLGNKMITQQFEDGTSIKKINTVNLASGVYIVIYKTNDQQVSTQIVVQH